MKISQTHGFGSIAGRGGRQARGGTACRLIAAAALLPIILSCGNDPGIDGGAGVIDLVADFEIAEPFYDTTEIGPPAPLESGVVLNGKGAERVVVRAFCSRPDIEENPMPLTIRINGKLSREFELHRPDLETIEIPIERRDRTSSLRVDLEVGRTWVPKDLNINDDPRELGVAVISVWADNVSMSGKRT